MANWSEINQDILFLIISRITNPSDHIRISGVCSSWRFVAKQTRCNLSHPIPGLIVSSPIGNFKKLKFLQFYSPSSLFSFELEEGPSHHRCCGSNEGWLVLVKEDRNSIYLFNPFIKRPLLLPDLGLLVENSNVGKAVLSSSPSIDPNCVVLILFEKQGAAFCKLEDKSWTKLQSFYGNYYDCDALSDALFFKGLFYVVDDYGKICTCNLDRQFLEEIPYQPYAITKIKQKWYLVELKREIYMVQRKFSIDEGFYYDDDDNLYDTELCCSFISTREFRIWKMDLGKKEWIRIWDLGAFALYLGCNNSVGISGMEVFGVQGNRIYFTDDRQRTKHFGFFWPGQDMGIFYMNDSSIKPLCWTQCEWLKDPPAVWISPLPW